MSTRIIQVDSFTDRPFAGNPAAVCLLDAPAPEPWMQHVAAEMNLSETAFVHPIEPGPLFRLRWFTPRVEVDLCGHATLAAAHVLWEEKLLRPQAPAQFETRSGRLSARRQGELDRARFPRRTARFPDHRPARARSDRRCPEGAIAISRAATGSTSWSSSPTSRPSGSSSRITA